ncbi:hypothetical protein ACPFP2_23620 [Micromonospora citrea]|uniref:hypothetical protein n=1 Tax=Micromonospora citrea TaxID=47855 RepID=UPI003C3E0E5A
MIASVRPSVVRAPGQNAQTTAEAWSRDLPPIPYEQTVATAQRRLAETGWRLDAVTTGEWSSSGEPVRTTTLDARRGDTVLVVTVNSRMTTESPYLSMTLWRTTPPAVAPAAVAGGLLGALAGWLVFGWASRRTERPHPAVAPVKVLAGVTLFLWSVPALFALPLMAVHHHDERHAQWHPFWEWLGQPVYSLFLLVGAVSALIGLALAALPRRDADPISTLAAG